MALMYTHHYRLQKGFTLIEMIVTIAVISLLSVVIAQSFFSSTRTSLKVEITKEAKQSGNFAISVMERMIRSAHAVTSTCATGGTSSTNLTIEDDYGQETTFGCVADGTVMRIASTSASGSEYLTSKDVTLGGAGCVDAAMTLQFLCTSYPSQPENVAISFTLSQANGSPDVIDKAQSSFQSSVNVRNLNQ